jgi:hypothetical protein
MSILGGENVICGILRWASVQLQNFWNTVTTPLLGTSRSFKTVEIT